MTNRRGSELEPAFLLHRRAYRNTSAIVELLTEAHGRVGAVVRGVYGRRHGSGNILQPFQGLRVSWQARGELATLTGFEAAGAPRTPVATWLVSGFYANELLLRLLAREDAHPGLLASYQQLIDRLHARAEQGPSLRVFERDLLAALGYGLALETDVHGAAIVADCWYRYDLEEGATVIASPRCAGIGVPGGALLALAAGRPTLADDARLKRLTRAALGLYLGPRPLKSRELYRHYHRPAVADPQEKP